jgi:hypothetical protein
MHKMTGEQEALLADRKLRQNGPGLVTELLASCVQQLGDLEPPLGSRMPMLSSPDRNYLLVELRKRTFGCEIEGSYVCPSCGETTSVVHDLDQLPLRRLDGEITSRIVVELEDGYEEGQRNGEPGDVHYTMVFRLPTGEDEEKVASAIRDNPARGMNALLARCLESVGTMPAERREVLGTRLFNDLTMADRARIEQTFRSEMPGYDLTQEVSCDHCNRPFQSSVDLTRFFSLQRVASASSDKRFSR